MRRADPIAPRAYKALRVTAQVALAFALFGSFALGFRMLGLPDLVQLALPQMRILQCLAYAIIVAFAVYLAVFAAVLRPLHRRALREARIARQDCGAFFPVPGAAEEGAAPDSPHSVSVEGLPRHRRVLHWSNSDGGEPQWAAAVESCSRNARIAQTDRHGRAVLRQARPQPYRDEAGRLRGAAVHYRVEVEPGVWSEAREIAV